LASGFFDARYHSAEDEVADEFDFSTAATIAAGRPALSRRSGS